MLTGSPQGLTQSFKNFKKNEKEFGNLVFSPKMKAKNLFSKNVFPVAGHIEDYIRFLQKILQKK